MSRNKKITNIVEAEKPLQNNVDVVVVEPQRVLVRMRNDNERVKEADVNFIHVDYLKSLGWKEI